MRGRVECGQIRIAAWSAYCSCSSEEILIIPLLRHYYLLSFIAEHLECTCIENSQILKIIN